jgi:colanic acid biosynthesis glycosyl transferase WcaI
VKIHQITHLFSPDSLGGAALYTDFARFMRDRGHEVRVTTTFSYYPRLSYLDEDRGQAVREETFEGMPLRRVAMALPKRHRGWRRLIPELTFWRALRKHGRFDGWRPDVVFTACPMLAQPLAARGLYGRDMPVVLVVQDLMADAARRLGIVRTPGLGRVLAAVETHALRGVDRLVTISPEMERRLRELAPAAPEIMVVPNWIHASLETIAKVSVTHRSMAGRAAGVLFYSGNLGVKQGLPDFLADFENARGEWRLRIHGDGAEAEALRAAQARHGGVDVARLLPEPEYVEQLSAASACVITQRRGSGDSFLPSKLLPALATGTPVLAVCEASSPLGREVATHGFGAVIEPGDREALRATLVRWAGEPAELHRLGEKARARAAAFQREAVLARYEQVLRESISRSHV